MIIASYDKQLENHENYVKVRLNDHFLSGLHFKCFANILIYFITFVPIMYVYKLEPYINMQLTALIGSNVVFR